MTDNDDVRRQQIAAQDRRHSERISQQAEQHRRRLEVLERNKVLDANTKIGAEEIKAELAVELQRIALEQDPERRRNAIIEAIQHAKVAVTKYAQISQIDDVMNEAAHRREVEILDKEAANLIKRALIQFAVDQRLITAKHSNALEMETHKTDEEIRAYRAKAEIDLEFHKRTAQFDTGQHSFIEAASLDELSNAMKNVSSML